jgi:hypothetical protein
MRAVSKARARVVAEASASPRRVCSLTAARGEGMLANMQLCTTPASHAVDPLRCASHKLLPIGYSAHHEHSISGMLANAVSWCAGALCDAYNPWRSTAALWAGARTRWQYGVQHDLLGVCAAVQRHTNTQTAY